MTSLPSRPATIRLQRLTTLHLLIAGATIVLIAVVAGWIGGLRINTTPSEPLGLWRIVPMTREVAPGDVVFICPPDNTAMQEARARGYLRAGICPGAFGPLIKTVIAMPGQQLQIAEKVLIDGVPVPNSAVVQEDGKGRSLLPYAGDVVPPGHVFVHSGFAGSWDSRYFGPLPVSGISGLAQEVWTYAP